VSGYRASRDGVVRVGATTSLTCGARTCFHIVILAGSVCVGPVAASPQEVAAKLAVPGVWAYVDATGEVRPSGSFTGVPPDEALTREGLERRQSFDFRTDDPVLGCGPPGMPRALTAASPMTFSWDDDVLIIRYESMDVIRRVPMGEDGPPPSAPRTPNGYSQARWDGDTLVIETTRLDGRVQDLLGTPKSDAMRLEERYEIEEAGGEIYLRADLIMTDDRYLAEPYLWHFDFVSRPDWELMEYACEERPAELTPGVVPDAPPSP